MNKELINNLRLDAGIAQVADSAKLVVINREGNIIDPIVGLEKFAELIIEECIDVVISSDNNPKMIVHEPYRTIMLNIQDHFYGIEDCCDDQDYS